MHYKMLTFHHKLNCFHLFCVTKHTYPPPFSYMTKMIGVQEMCFFFSPGRGFSLAEICAVIVVSSTVRAPRRKPQMILSTQMKCLSVDCENNSSAHTMSTLMLPLSFSVFQTVEARGATVPQISLTHAWKFHKLDYLRHVCFSAAVLAVEGVVIFRQDVKSILT